MLRLLRPGHVPRIVRHAAAHRRLRPLDRPLAVRLLQVRGRVLGGAPARAGGEYNQDQLIFSAAAQGYDTENGVVFENAGFLNVTVSTDRVTVDYVKNIKGCTEEPCSEIVTSYSVEKN